MAMAASPMVQYVVRRVVFMVMISTFTLGCFDAGCVGELRRGLTAFFFLAARSFASLMR